MAALKPADKPNQLGCAILAVAGLVLFATVAPGESEAPSPAEAAEDKRKGFHCLSRWDGSHPGFVDRVRDRLRDPASFEHAETKVTPEAEGKHTILMRYRARNGFGGMNLSAAAGTFDHETCEPSEPAFPD